MDATDVVRHLEEIRNCIKDPEKRVSLSIAIGYVKRHGVCSNYSSFEGMCVSECKPCRCGGYKDVCKK